MAVIIFYRRNVRGLFVGLKTAFISLFKGTFKSQAINDSNVKMLGAIIAGTVPTGIIGIMLTDAAAFTGKTALLLGMSFLVCSGILLMSLRWKGGDKMIDFKSAVIIGIAQGLAVMPGISRSGTTICVALLLGIKREEAAKFSFLLSIPAILGAAVLELDFKSLAAVDSLSAVFTGTLAAFAVGILALALLVRVVKAGRLWLFAPYVAIVGISVVSFL
jgi:undecaprenyl-diphosphatase